MAKLVAPIGSGLTWAVVAGLLYLGLPIWSEKPPEIVGVSLGQLLVAVAGAVALGWFLLVWGVGWWLAERAADVGHGAGARQVADKRSRDV
jgi:hypothetical protein